MKYVVTSALASTVGCALCTWMYHELSHKPGTKNPVTEKVTAAANWIYDMLLYESGAENPVQPMVTADKRIYSMLVFESDAENPVQPTVTADDSEHDNEELVLETTREVSPAHFLIKIEHFALFSEYGIYKHETREFEAGGYKWRLVIYPDGEKRKGDHISVYLTVVETSSLPMDWEFNAIFTIFLYNQISDEYLCFSQARRFNETKSEWGFPKFISKKILRDRSSGFLVNDNLVLGAEVFVLKSQRVVDRITLLEPVYLTHNVKIPEFSKMGDVWISDEFLIKGFNWKMMVYPKGDFRSKDNAADTYLTCVTAESFATHQKVKAKFFLRLIGMSDAPCLTVMPKPVLQVERNDMGWCDSQIRECTLDHWFTSSSTSRGYSFRRLNEKIFAVNGWYTLQVQICVQVIV